MARMPDVPRATQNTFICYSKLPRDGARQPVPGGIPCFQSPAFRSFTGIASVNGRLDNDLVSIVPKVDENGGFSWEITGKKQAEAGTFSFSVTVTTKGSDKFAAISQMFTFQVVVYRNAVPQPQTTFIQLAVGESIDTAGLIPWVINPVIDYNVRHEGPLEDSGLYIACDKTDRGAITNVHLRGTAAKVGTYLFLTEAQTWDEGGQYDYLPSSFPAGSGSVPVVVSVYEKFGAGTVIVQDPEAEYLRNPDFLRLLSGGYTGSALGVFSRSGDIWSRTARELINASFNLYEVFDYQVARSGDIWQLSGRRYFSDETPSEFEVLASAPVVPGSEIPPSGTWSGGVTFVGDTRYFVEGRGFFDNKGLEGGFQGWDGSFLIPDGSGGWQIDGAAVFPAELTGGTALPYSPATSEKVGKHTVRDLAQESLNLNRLPDAGQLAFTTGANGTTGGYWPFYPLHRQIAPPNGTDGTVAQGVSGRFRVERRYEMRNDSSTERSHESNEGEASHDNISLREKRKDNYNASFSPESMHCATRDSGDFLKRVFIYENEVDNNFNLDKTYDYEFKADVRDGTGGFSVHDITTERSEVIENLGSNADLQLYISSGREGAEQRAKIFSTGTAAASGSWKIKTKKNIKNDYAGDVTESEEVSEATVSASASFDADILREGIGFPVYRLEERNDSVTYSDDARRSRAGGDSDETYFSNSTEHITEVEIIHTAHVVYKNGEVDRNQSRAVTVVKKLVQKIVRHGEEVDNKSDEDEQTFDNDYDASIFQQVVDGLDSHVNDPGALAPDCSISHSKWWGETDCNAQFHGIIDRIIRTFSGSGV